MKTIRVLLVDDHAVVRAGLRALIESADDIRVVGEAENGHEAVGAASRLRPDIILMDVGMPRLNGIQAARQIIHEAPRARVLVLSSYSEEQQVLEAIEAGIAGYVVKQSAGIELLNAIRETAGGAAYFSPGVLNHVLKQLRGKPTHGREPTARPPSLSRRYAEVLQLIAEGYCTKQIAALLSISLKTAERHRYGLMMKLKMHKVAILTRYAVSSGVIESSRMPNCPAAPRPVTPDNCANPGLMM
jgi:DNA-binding NarL/FixJ family response regulator